MRTTETSSIDRITTHLYYRRVYPNLFLSCRVLGFALLSSGIAATTFAQESPPSDLVEEITEHAAPDSSKKDGHSVKLTEEENQSSRNDEQEGGPAKDPSDSPDTEEKNETEDPLTEDLPTALPPLSQELFSDPMFNEDQENVGNSVILIASGRMRLEMDESRDLAPEDDLQVGVAYTGRLGADIPLGPHRARLVLGDGKRIGQDRGTLAGPWVDPTPLGYIQHLNLQLEFPAFGAPAQVHLGRQEVTIADGRWLGTAPFDPRGRVVDGIVIQQERLSIRLQGGALYLGRSSYDNQLGTVLYLQGLGFLNLSYTNQHLQFDVYNLVHRDTLQNILGESIGYWIATAGFRSDYSRWGFLAGIGFDVQIPVDETDIAGINSAGIHAEARIRYAPELNILALKGIPYIELSSEWTGGKPKFGRTFRAPGPSYHAFLGSLDLVSTDNVASSAIEAGLQAQEFFETGTQARVIALADKTGRLYDTFGRVLLDEDEARTKNVAFVEVDAFARVILPYGLYAQTEAGIAFPGDILDREVPVIRLLLTLGFDAELNAFSAPSLF